MTVFTVANREFGWDEIVIAAEVWNEWQPFIETTRQSLACLQLAEKSNQLPKPAEIRDAATAFRYAHNLISAEETNAWLQRWQISVDDWMTYLRGRCLRDRWAGQLDEIVAACSISDDSLTAVIKHHAVCSDRLRDWAIKLAGRAAVAARSSDFFTIQSSIDLITHIESEFEQKRQQTITPKLIENQIAHHQLDWICFDCRYLWFAEERVAREAAWCVSEDGLTLDEVAQEAHGEIKSWKVYADEIDVQVRPYFLAARQGEVLGPLKIWQGFPLFSLLNKKLPAVDDPQIRARAEHSILASFTEHAIFEQVKWVA